ncbi:MULTISPECIES: ATP-binding protein [Serratia]|uniref:ATP-binding protein n=1 Tax=Serratia TaxID=613 RepID=UPI0007450F23|nr:MULTISPECIES: ATP-binding protein [Serratia]MBE4975459.1 ATP-binding protein [Serratia sp. X3]MBH2650427.1 ATP-binding protein [Serratia ureilytica]MDP8634754.1 ATP-binding protein [Serratia marcescens]MDP8868255.1 ATP-binding protein [Serratia marcescens]UNE45496.1 ATP-binding protein [Serratia ureilytica]
MRASEVFTPGSFPAITFVDDHLKEKEQQLLDVLETGSMLISISGPSKSGKTVFVEKLLGKESLIQVTGAGITSAEGLWLKVFDVLGTPITKSTTTGNTSSINASGKVSGQAGIIFAKASAEGNIGGAIAQQNAESTSQSIDYLQLLISEVGGTDFIIFIDDFHYIPRDVQSELAKQIKEAIRNGCKFICASVPYHSDDVIKGNPDLSGRFFSINFDYWGGEILEQIAIKGFSKLNIECNKDVIKKMVDESAGSPQLMQYLCLNSCFELGAREVQQVILPFPDDAAILDSICKRTVLATDFSSVINKMLDGPKTRGSERKVYIMKDGSQGDVYRILIKAIALSPPQLNYRYHQLVERITRICTNEIPSGSSITSACLHSSTLANNSSNENVIEWDSENDVLDIRDPYLLFFIRWSESIQ